MYCLLTTLRKTTGCKKARQGIAIMVLLGLTWAFGILAIGDTKMIFQYLFCIFNTFQGLFVFIFFGILPVGTKAKLQNFIQKIGALNGNREVSGNHTFNSLVQSSREKPSAFILSASEAKNYHQQSILVRQNEKVHGKTRHSALVIVQEAPMN